MNLAILGDIAFNGIISNQPEKNELRYDEIKKYLKKFDLVFANLEIPVKAGYELNEYKNFTHYTDEIVVKELLQTLNIGCVSLANNHIYDFKMGGLRATIKTLDELGIYHTGAGWKKEHTEPLSFKIGNEKISFLAYVDPGTNPKTEYYSELYINYFSYEHVISDIERVRTVADKVIVSIHWGIDYSHYPTPLQRTLSKRLIDKGADIIMGHHPHTLQPFELYNDGLIFYSLGGLVFGDFFRNGQITALPRKTKKGIIVHLNNNQMKFTGTIDKKGNTVQLFKFNYEKWSDHKFKIYNLTQKFIWFKHAILFKENILDPGWEYFFGYYNSPLKRLIKISNIKKIRRLLFRYGHHKNKTL